MSEPVVDADDVRHIAALANIELDADDIERFRSEFADILEYFDRLEDVPDVEPSDTTHNVLRSDEVQPSLSQAESLQNASQHEDGYFKGPPVS